MEEDNNKKRKLPSSPISSNNNSHLFSELSSELGSLEASEGDEDGDQVDFQTRLNFVEKIVTLFFKDKQHTNNHNLIAPCFKLIKKLEYKCFTFCDETKQSYLDQTEKMLKIISNDSFFLSLVLKYADIPPLPVFSTHKVQPMSIPLHYQQQQQQGLMQQQQQQQQQQILLQQHHQLARQAQQINPTTTTSNTLMSGVFNHQQPPLQQSLHPLLKNHQVQQQQQQQQQQYIHQNTPQQLPLQQLSQSLASNNVVGSTNNGVSIGSGLITPLPPLQYMSKLSQEMFIRELKDLFDKYIDPHVIEWVSFFCNYHMGNTVTMLIDLKIHKQQSSNNNIINHSSSSNSPIFNINNNNNNNLY